MVTSSSRTGVACVLAAAALWGTTGTAQSFASGELSAAWFGALRLVVASAFFALCAAATTRRADARPGGARGSWPTVLGAGGCMAAYNLAFFAGIRGTGIAVGTALALGSGPLWAGLLQWILTHQAPGRRWWLGTLVAIAGGALLCGVGSPAATALDAAGAVLCLSAGLAYAGYTLCSQRLVRTMPTAHATFSAFLVAATVAVPCAAAWSGPPIIRTADAWAVAYVGVATAGVSYLLFNHALRHIGAATGVTLALGEPVVAFLLAVTVVGEPASRLSAFGLLLVVGGVITVVRAELQAASRTATALRSPGASAAASP